MILRDPRFGTARYFYLKNGSIIHSEAVTSYLVESSRLFLEDEVNKTEIIKNKLKSVGADSFFELHNHPRGNVKVSDEDIDSSNSFSQIDEYVGSIVIDHNRYLV